MMHIAWCCLEEVPYWSYVKFQGHTAHKIVEFDPNWVFPNCNSSLNSPMASKLCIKLEVALKRCPIVFQGHTSNVKVTRLTKLSNLTQIGCFRTVTPVWNMHKAWSSIEEMPYCFSRSSVKFQGHTALKIVEFDPDWSFPDCNSILNSPMAQRWCTKLEVALKRCPFFKVICQISRSHGSKNRRIWRKPGVSRL